MNSVTTSGFGNTLPVAWNDHAAGRQQNRRVELVVSGEAIGNPIGARRENCVRGIDGMSACPLLGARAIGLLRLRDNNLHSEKTRCRAGHLAPARTTKR